ncbi:RrF2 family transcriptional regulator [Acuticoccus mangrovi]|uniref:Rrf2 family transcriptional regulator n=1 Tax=Acuticoccus mangrovi TaxID=2796142 RepID=A0A934ILH4_9HYPH|nr:Rrf2 family transcriptional regulator [Acuticoccus mangrovi]MBJ3776012.1 Rrf2 family transcriptional regulator [Acuticoccus mangrovi]
MRLTEQTRYALRVLAHCATHHPDLVRVGAIAQTTELSEYTIFKLLKTATKADLITSYRGRNGGIRLAADPDRITIGTVVRAFEPRFRDCQPAELIASQRIYDGTVDRNLNLALGQGLKAFLSALDRMTLLDLITDDHVGPLTAQARALGLGPRPVTE